MRFVFLVFVLVASNLQAEVTPLGILNIDFSGSSEPALVYASDGVIYEVDSNNKSLLAQLEFAKNQQLEVDLEITDNGELTDTLEIRDEILGLTPLNNKTYSALMSDPKFFGNIKNGGPTPELMNEKVTDFDSLEDATEYFKTQRTDTKRRSQCYNRAHVWAWELLKRQYKGEKIHVGKLWIFWSKFYTRKYRFKWWFHIAPFVTVKGDLKVMDRSFMKAPIDTQEWVDNLVKVKITCKEVYKYSSYRQHQDTADCFFIKSSVYYWQPFQIENLEKEGPERNKWVDGEIIRAYKNAISRWIRRVP